MTTEAANTFADLEAGFESEDAFDPTEMFNLNEVVSIKTVPMPPEMLKGRNLDPEADAFKAMFPDGIACVEVAVKGIDVSYDFADDKIRRITVEMVNYQGKNAGKAKGANSHLHILQEAFTEIFGHGLFGPAHRAALVGKKARWGQHFGNAVIGGDKRTWAWDVPREVLDDGFTYTGDVRSVGGEKSGDGATQAGADELSDEDALIKVLEVAVGKKTDQGEAIHSDVLKIQGLPEKYVTLAATGDLLMHLYDEELVDQEGGVIIAKAAA